jgi:small subunit ribosomal protein S19
MKDLAKENVNKSVVQRMKKPPHVDFHLYKKVDKVLKSGDKTPIKTYSRRSIIINKFIGLTFHVHNGKAFVPVFVTEAQVGHRFGEFAMTRKFGGHPTKERNK